MTIDKPLLALTAADLMNPMFLTIPENMSIQGAAHLLAQAHISGAPVVDSDGRCVGVISAQDFVALADQGPRSAKQPSHAECFCSAWQIVNGDQLPEDVVRNYMTADPVTVSTGGLVGTLAQTMVDAHIHRVIVLDRSHRPIGVVSSIDVLAAVARAARADRFELLHRIPAPSEEPCPAEKESSHVDHEPLRAQMLTLRAETAAELMTWNPVSLRAQATVDEARELFLAKEIGAAPVIDEAGHPIGVLSHSDIVVHDAVGPTERSVIGVDYGESPDGVPAVANLRAATSCAAALMTVEDLMTPAVFAVSAETSAAEVVKSMLEYRVHHIFVVDGQGVLTGVISTLDVLRHLRA